MCKQIILAQNQNGNVALCCKNLNHQIANISTYISTILTLTVQQFSEFASQVSNQLHYSDKHTDENHKTFCVHTFSVNTQIILSFNELRKLVYLLDEANASMQVNKFLLGDLQTVLIELQKDNKHQFLKSIN